MAIDDRELRDGFVFRAGNVSLDFTTTLAGRRKPEHIERLETPKDLARWLKAAGLARSILVAGEADLVAARRLREAIYALASARAQGATVSANARHELNRLAAGTAATVQLDADGDMRFRGSAQNLLTSIAQEAVRVLSGEQSLRSCAGDHCAIIFVDTSRAGDRRWCSMSACGNRAKAAEFRRRKNDG